jgi:hypothetical protein
MKSSDQHNDGENVSGQLSRRFLLGSGAVAGAVAGAAALVSPTLSAVAATTTRPPTGTTDGGITASEFDDIDPGELPQDSSTFFSTVFVEQAGTYAAPGSDGDLWANCWADDDNIYAANGDGRGFSDEPFQDVVVSRIMGTPETGITGEKVAQSDQVAKIWGDPTLYNRKPTGMACVNGVLYLAVQDLKYGDNAFDDAPNASISKSTDHGATWTITEEAMFTDHRFTTIFFLDFGKNAEHATAALGQRDGRYLYAYGLDWNWRQSVTRTVPDPVDLYLGRVPVTSVQDRGTWQFFAGIDKNGNPSWSADIHEKKAVLSDPLRRYADPLPNNSGSLTVISQGGVLYHPVFKRYIYTSWTDPSFEFYESPTPWGPWNRFHYFNAGLTTWYRSNNTTNTPKNGGYGTTLPSKFVSADGRSLWLQSNWWDAPAPTPADNYNFNLRKVHLTPYRSSRPSNQPNSRNNLARSGSDVTGIEIALEHAHDTYLNDGNLTLSEDSNDGTNKLVDFWGYTFTTAYRLNRLVYTAGATAADGGWFSPYNGGLRVQVRQNQAWVDAAGLRITPDYPYDATAGPSKTYTLRFDTTWGDGVRIIGEPDGASHYTSIAELEVYYDG